MNDSNRGEFAMMIKLTAEMYGRQEPSMGLIQMYFSALVNYSLDDVRAGINAHVQDPDQGQFFPKPADIVRNIRGSSETQAYKAWTKVDRAIKGAGGWSTVVFDDRIIHAVISEMGGWIELCKVTEKEYPFKQNEFIKRYRSYVINPPMNHPKLLIGIADAHNGSKGFESDKPVVIGDKSQARLVYKSGNDNSRIGISTFENTPVLQNHIKRLEVA